MLKTGYYPDLLGTGKSLLITGVGLTATAFHLGKILATSSFDGAVNFGVAGAFDLSIQLGTTVQVIEDEFADLGAENNDEFVSLFEMNLQNENEAPFSNGKLVPMGDWKSIGNLQKVRGASVNTVHGNAQSIANFKARSNAQIETMEGAAFFYACSMGGVDSLQIRAISNYVEPRNRENWKLEEAIQSLAIYMKQYFINPV